MGEKIQLDVVTPSGLSLVGRWIWWLPGRQWAVWHPARAYPFGDPVRGGILKIFDNDEVYRMAVSDGYLEVTPEKVVVLAEAAELPEEIDVERALAAKRRAEERLAGLTRSDIDFVRTQASLQRALNRLRLVEEAKRHGDK